MKFKAPEWMTPMIDSAKRAQLYIIAQPGPLIFIIKESNKDETVKTSLGSPHKCSCSEGSLRHFCIHISFLLQRKYKLPSDHPWLTRVSLTNSELESLLQMKHLDSNRSAHRTQRFMLKETEQRCQQQGAIPPENMRKRNPLTVSDSCPICLEGFFSEDHQDIDYSVLPFCSCCGNSTHTRCIQMYIQHARQTKTKELCPYCRSPYEDGRQHEQTERPQRLLKVCQRCENKLESIAIKRVLGTERYCTACFVTLNSGMYEKKGRKIVYKQKQSTRNQSRERALTHEFYRRFAALQYRDITMEDYNLLLELENPYMANVGKKQQRFPSYLVWDCFKQSSYIGDSTMASETNCFLCRSFHPLLSNLFVPKENNGEKDIITDFNQFNLTLNLDSITMLLLEQGEQRVSTTNIQELIDHNIFLELPCSHTVHKVCAVLGSLMCNLEAIFKLQDTDSQRLLSNYKLRVFPDYCIDCKAPFLNEWLRGSKLAAKSQQIVNDSPSFNTLIEQESVLKGQHSEISFDGSFNITNFPLPEIPSARVKQTNSSTTRSKSMAPRHQNKSRSTPPQNSSITINSLLHVTKPTLAMGIIVKPA